MQFKNILIISFFSAFLLISCNKKELQFEDPLITNRDTTVSPSEDFFHYANGGWFKKHPIPNSESSNGIF
jgi:putative endopeptidase